MKLAVTHRNSSSLKVANNTIISHFCTCALAGATRLCACEHARSSRFSQQSRLLRLGLAQFCGRKLIFRSALQTKNQNKINSNHHFSKPSVLQGFRSFKLHLVHLCLPRVSVCIQIFCSFICYKFCHNFRRLFEHSVSRSH